MQNEMRSDPFWKWITAGLIAALLLSLIGVGYLLLNPVVETARESTSNDYEQALKDRLTRTEARLTAENESLRQEIQTLTLQSTASQDTLIASAKIEANKIIEESRVLANQQLEIAIKRGLDLNYPNHYPYQDGNNVVNLSYIQSFSVSSNQCTIRMKNPNGVNGGSVQPSFTLTFLNEFGLPISGVGDGWVFDTLGPQEEYVETYFLDDRYGSKPKYYALELY